jgi:hypothetical protein
VLAALVVTAAAVLVVGGALLVVSALEPSAGFSVGGSAVLAGRLVVLASGGELRTASGPLVLAPLLLTAGLLRGLVRATRWAVHVGRGRAGRAARVAGVLVVAHVTVVAALAAAVGGPGAAIGWGRTLAGAAVLAAVAAGWGSAGESGAADALLDRLPGTARPVLRGVAVGAVALLALCLAVVAVALAGDVRGYARITASLGGAGAGAVGLLGLGLLLLPNAAAAVLGLAAGPGFSVGAATVVSVHGVTLGAVPALPLLAALPDTQAVPLLAFASQAVPVLGGLVAGGAVGRRLGDDAGGSLVAALAGLVSGALLGVVGAAFVAAGGGSLGSGGLAVVGAPALATGLAVALQAAPAAALGAAVARWRRR